MGMGKGKFSLKGNFPWLEDFQVQGGLCVSLGKSLTIPAARPSRK